MKQIFTALMMITMTSAANAVVTIQSPTSSREEFAAFLKSQPEAVSYIRYQAEKFQSNPPQEDALYRISENLESSPQEILNQLRNIESGAPLSSTSINFAYDLSTKLQERADLKDNLEMKTLHCKVRGLLAMPLGKCKKVKVDLVAIARQWPFMETLLVESSAYELATASHLEISSEASYQFTLLSNSHKAIVFKGTYVQFMQQHFSAEPLIAGSCYGYSASVDDFHVTSSGMVFFNPTCVKPINAPPVENGFSQWMEKNKSWVYPVGILLIGGAGAYALKDKKIVITKP